MCVFITDLSVVTGGDQQICEHQQLVICELLLVFLPVIMMSATEIRQGFLHSHLEKQQIYIYIKDLVSHSFKVTGSRFS